MRHHHQRRADIFWTIVLTIATLAALTIILTPERDVPQPSVTVEDQP